MKKLLAVWIVTLTIMALEYSCTENQSARNYGGTETVQLEEGVRVVNVTWKGDEQLGSLWILTKKDTTTKPTTYSFKEKSNFGVMEGTVIIIEK
jgi:hypothetical protein